MADDDDGGLPEESQGKLEQTSTVDHNTRAPWKVDGDPKYIFQNYDDLIEFGSEVPLPSGTGAKYVIVIVIDNNNPAITAHYPQHKQFYIGEVLPNGDIYWRPYTEFWIKLIEDGRTTNSDSFTKFRINAIGVGTYRSIPILVPDPSFNHNRPVTQSEATTSSTTGTTVVTTTTANPAAAGVVTTSETIPAALDAFGGAGRNIPSAQQASGVLPSPGPCLPNNPPASSGVSGSGAVPPVSTYDDGPLRAVRAATTSSGSTYDDGPLRAVRAAAAAPASTYDDGPLRAVRAAASGSSTAAAAANSGSAAAAAAANSGSAAAAAAAASTAPTTVTQQPSTPTSSSSAPVSTPSNVYIYEPLTPGFDRYDFNSGKKVFTPDSGPSRNSSNSTVTPTPAPRVPSNANRDYTNINLQDVDQTGRLRGGL